MDEDDRRNGKTTKPPPPVFEAAGFTFVADVSLMTIEPYVSSTANVDAQTSIQHDHSRRKNRQFCHCLRQQASNCDIPSAAATASQPPSPSKKEVPTLAFTNSRAVDNRSESANILDLFATRPLKPSADATIGSWSANQRRCSECR